MAASCDGQAYEVSHGCRSQEPKKSFSYFKNIIMIVQKTKNLAFWFYIFVIKNKSML